MPSTTTVPSWFVIVVRRRVIGLSSRASSTSTSAVISSPGRTGALKLQSVVQEDRAGAGEVLGDDGVQQAGGDAALDDDPAEARSRGDGLVVVERVAVAGQLGEELDVPRRDAARAAGGVADVRHAPTGLHGSQSRTGKMRRRAGVAQLVEHPPCKRAVVGSSPISGFVTP